MSARPVHVLILALALAATGAPAQPGPAPTPAPCASPAHHALDFWIGAWEVRRTGAPADAPLAGRSEIRAILGGCVIHERWEGARMRGESFSLFDASRGLWSQSWADSGGGLHLYRGVVEPDGVLFEADLANEDGSPGRAPHRMRFTRLGPDRVRQHGQTSADGGLTWTTTYDLTYARAPAAAPAAGTAAP